MSASLALAFISVYSFFTFDYKGLNFSEAAVKTLQTLQTMVTEPQFKHFTFLEALYKVFITMGLAFLTTLFGAVVALFIGLFAARNLTNKTISNAIRAFVAVVRAIPTVLWVLIFAVAAGLGSVGVISVAPPTPVNPTRKPSRRPITMISKLI